MQVIVEWGGWLGHTVSVVKQERMTQQSQLHPRLPDDSPYPWHSKVKLPQSQIPILQEDPTVRGGGGGKGVDYLQWYGGHGGNGYGERGDQPFPFVGSVHNRHVVLSEREFHKNNLFINFCWSPKTTSLNPCCFKTLKLGNSSVKSVMVQIHNKCKGDKELIHQSPPKKSSAPYPDYCILYFWCWTPPFESVGSSYFILKWGSSGTCHCSPQDFFWFKRMCNPLLSVLEGPLLCLTQRKY